MKTLSLEIFEMPKLLSNLLSLVPNSVTTIFGFAPTGRHETIRITEGDGELIYTLSAMNVKYML